MRWHPGTTSGGEPVRGKDDEKGANETGGCDTRFVTLRATPNRDTHTWQETNTQMSAILRSRVARQILASGARGYASVPEVMVRPRSTVQQSCRDDPTTTIAKSHFFKSSPAAK